MILPIALALMIVAGIVVFFTRSHVVTVRTEDGKITHNMNVVEPVDEGFLRRETTEI